MAHDPNTVTPATSPTPAAPARGRRPDRFTKRWIVLALLGIWSWEAFHTLPTFDWPITMFLVILLELAGILTGIVATILVLVNLIRQRPRRATSILLALPAAMAISALGLNVGEFRLLGAGFWRDASEARIAAKDEHVIILWPWHHRPDLFNSDWPRAYTGYWLVYDDSDEIVKPPNERSAEWLARARRARIITPSRIIGDYERGAYWGRNLYVPGAQPTHVTPIHEAFGMLWPAHPHLYLVAD